MNNIGPDVEKMIYEYKQQMEDIENHMNKMKNVFKEMFEKHNCYICKKNKDYKCCDDYLHDSSKYLGWETYKCFCSQRYFCKQCGDKDMNFCDSFRCSDTKMCILEYNQK